MVAKQHAEEFYLPGHAYLDAERLGIQVGFQVEPLEGEDDLLLHPHVKDTIKF